MYRRNFLKGLGFILADAAMPLLARAEATVFPIINVSDYGTSLDIDRTEIATRLALHVVEQGGVVRRNPDIEEIRHIFEQTGAVYDLWVTNRNETGLASVEAESFLAPYGRERCWYNSETDTLIHPDSLGIAYWNGTLAELIARGTVPMHEFISVEDIGIDGQPNHGHIPGKYFAEGYIPREELSHFQDLYDIVYAINFRTINI